MAEFRYPNPLNPQIQTAIFNTTPQRRRLKLKQKKKIYGC